MLLYFNMAPAVLSECRELSGATLSNMILLADRTPDCGYLADRHLSKQFLSKQSLYFVVKHVNIEVAFKIN